LQQRAVQCRVQCRVQSLKHPTRICKIVFRGPGPGPSTSGPSQFLPYLQYYSSFAPRGLFPDRLSCCSALSVAHWPIHLSKIGETTVYWKREFAPDHPLQRWAAVPVLLHFFILWSCDYTAIWSPACHYSCLPARLYDSTLTLSSHRRFYMGASYLACAHL